MIELKERLEKKLRDEERVIDRYKKEVTVDYPAVKAEHRVEFLKEVLEMVDGRIRRETREILEDAESIRSSHPGSWVRDQGKTPFAV